MTGLLFTFKIKISLQIFVPFNTFYCRALIMVHDWFFSPINPMIILSRIAKVTKTKIMKRDQQWINLLIDLLYSGMTQACKIIFVCKQLP